MVWWKRKKTFRVKSHPLSHRLLGYGFKEIWRSDLINIFQAEHDLRMLVQREEALERKVKALVKTASIDDKLDQTQLEEIKTELQGLQPKITMHEYYLYRAEGELSPAFGSLYTKLRLNPKWFMRPGMVSDCANRGGCCSRGCGCCAHVKDDFLGIGRKALVIVPPSARAARISAGLLCQTQTRDTSAMILSQG